MLTISAKSSVLVVQVNSEYVSASNFPGTWYILLGKEVLENQGANFDKCLVRLCGTKYCFYQEKSFYNLFN